MNELHQQQLCQQQLHQKPRRKRIPYGMMNLADVRESDCYFVDKTRFI